MSRRGFWFLSVAIGLVALSLSLDAQFSIGFLGLSAILWFSLQWAWVEIRAALFVRRLQVVRTIDHRDLHHIRVWENKPAEVRVSIESSTSMGVGWIHVRDLLPAGIEVRGDSSSEGRCEKDRPIVITYQVRMPGPGRFVFEGVRVHIEDVAGFFAKDIVLRKPETVTVYPTLVPERKLAAGSKRLNRIVAMGLHHHPQAGSGSELLNLRDYQPGDPPRRIAWKVSARRDQLTTKEFESEVPVRCTIFIDESDSVRVGWPGPTALDQSVRVSIALARRLLEHLDPVGVCIIGDERFETFPPARGSRHQSRLLQRLCDLAARPPRPSACPVPVLIEPAQHACRRHYPEPWNPRLNHRRWWPWVTVRQLMSWPLGTALALVAVAAGWWAISTMTLGPAAYLALGFLFLFMSWWAARTFMPPSALRPSAAQQRDRQRVASVLAVVDRSGPWGVAQGIHDDRYFSERAQELLLRHRIPYARPLHDADGRYVFESRSKIHHASRALMYSILRARDNELFVLMIDLLEHQHTLGELLDAIKVARARHHDVLVLCPWPAEIPMPGQGIAPAAESRPMIQRYLSAFQSISADLGKAGISIVPVSMTDSVEQVLRRLDALRRARISGRALR